MKANELKDYVPFSEQWEKEMMKFDKKSLIHLLKIKLEFIEAHKSGWNAPIEVFREFLMRSNFAFPQSEEDINYFDEGVTPQMMERFLEFAGLSSDEIMVPNQGWDDMSVAQPEFTTRKAYNESKLKK